MAKQALITGITGQDGSYSAEVLLEKGYEVHGIVRRVALEDIQGRLSRIQHILKDLNLHAASLESYASLFKVVGESKPDECYHLAAQSFVSYSFDDEFSTFNTNINGTHFILSALKDLTPDCRFYLSRRLGSWPIRCYDHTWASGLPSRPITARRPFWSPSGRVLTQPNRGKTDHGASVRREPRSNNSWSMPSTCP